MTLDPSRDPRALVDPDLLAGLAAMPQVQRLGPQTLAALRAQNAEMARLQSAGVDMTGVDFTITTMPGPPGAPDVPVHLYRPVGRTAPGPAYLHLHGGGYVLGTPAMRHANSVTLARDLGCLVASVDYRLAPETRAPGAVEDAHAVLVHLARHADAFGIDPARIAIGGESAGGGLAAALALFARDRGEARVVFQVLIYPMLDDRTCVRAEPHPHAGAFVWTPEGNHFGWSAHLGHPPGLADVSPYAAPARATDLTGLPPAFIAVGALDLFVDEDLDYAHRLVRAGVPTECHLYPGAFHAFDRIETAPVAQAFRRDWLDALRRALARP